MQKPGVNSFLIGKPMGWDIQLEIIKVRASSWKLINSASSSLQLYRVASIDLFSRVICASFIFFFSYLTYLYLKWLKLNEISWIFLSVNIAFMFFFLISFKWKMQMVLIFWIKYYFVIIKLSCDYWRNVQNK